MSDDIIRMAREAGVEFTFDPTESGGRVFAECWLDELERFAELVRADAIAKEREWVGLTDEEIQEAITKAVRERKLSWLGFKKDDQGEYTIPVLSLSDYQMARATEAKLKEKNHG